LKHTAATFLRKEFGLDTVRFFLGHSFSTLIDVFTELDYEKTAQIMAQAYQHPPNQQTYLDDQ